MRVSGMAAQLTATIGLSARGLVRCISGASIPLPVPVSPRMNTGGGRRAADHRPSSRPARSRSARISGLWPRRSDSVSTGDLVFLGLQFRVLGLARLELADHPPVALTDDFELVLGVPHRIAAAPERGGGRGRVVGIGVTSVDPSLALSHLGAAPRREAPPISCAT